MCVYGPVTFLGIRRSAVVVAAGLAAVVWTDWCLSARFRNNGPVTHGSALLSRRLQCVRCLGA